MDTDTVQKRSTRKRAPTKRYIAESESYGVASGAHIALESGSTGKEETEFNGADEAEEVEEPDNAFKLKWKDRRDRPKEFADIPDFLGDIDVEDNSKARKVEEQIAWPKSKHQTQKNVEQFLKECPHLNAEKALLFLREYDLKSAIELGKQVRLPNQTPAWLDDKLLSDPTCLRAKGKWQSVLLVDQLKNVVSREAFIEAALKAKIHRPIDHVQLMVDVAPEEYTPEPKTSDKKKKYTEPTPKSGSSRSSTSNASDHVNQRANNTSRRIGRRSGAQHESENGTDRRAQNAETLYSLRPKTTTEEVFNDSNVPTFEYEPYNHLSSDGAGPSTSAYRPIIQGRTISFRMDEEEDGRQPSTSGSVSRSRPSRSAKMTKSAQHEEEGDDDNNDDDDEEYNKRKTKKAKPSCSQGKKK